MAEEEDAPPAVPEWEPSELAKRIASGHARDEHFPGLDVSELAILIQRVFERAISKAYLHRTMYWDEEDGIVVIVNPRDPDGGTALPSERRYFERWGEVGP